MMKPGDPLVCLSGRYTGLVGRFVGTEGEFDAILLVRTPHGTTIKAGQLWWKEAKGEDLKKLEAYEFDVQSKPRRTSEVYR